MSRLRIVTTEIAARAARPAPLMLSLDSGIEASFSPTDSMKSGETGGSGARRGGACGRGGGEVAAAGTVAGGACCGF